MYKQYLQGNHSPTQNRPNWFVPFLKIVDKAMHSHSQGKASLMFMNFQFF